MITDLAEENSRIAALLRHRIPAPVQFQNEILVLFVGVDVSRRSSDAGDDPVGHGPDIFHLSVVIQVERPTIHVVSVEELLELAKAPPLRCRNLTDLDGAEPDIVTMILEDDVALLDRSKIGPGGKLARGHSAVPVHGTDLSPQDQHSVEPVLDIPRAMNDASVIHFSRRVQLLVHR